MKNLICVNYIKEKLFNIVVCKRELLVSLVNKLKSVMYHLVLTRRRSHSESIIFFMFIIILIVIDKNLFCNENNVASLFLIFNNLKPKNITKLNQKLSYIQIIKRNMMAAGTELTPYQKKLAVAILTLHIRYLKNPEINSEGFLDNMVEGMAIYGKAYQHLITVMYPGFLFSGEILSKKFPNLGIENPERYYDLNYAFAVAAGHNLKKEIPFSHGRLIVCDVPTRSTSFQNLSKNSPAFLETKQHFPDFHFSYKSGLWSRHFDYKSGEMSPNSGHVKLISDPVEYTEKSQKLFFIQCRDFTSIYPNTELSITLQKLKTDINIRDWHDIYYDYKLYIASQLQNYPKLNPSFIYHSKISYENLNLKNDKNIEGIVNTKSFCTLEKSQQTLREVLESSKETIQKNYKLLNPLGLGEKKGLLYQLKDLIDNVIS